MPTEYTCSACTLKVTLGSFHSHDVSDGYGGSTLLMCVQCGAQHSIRIAIGPEARASMMRPRVFWDVVLTDAGEHRVKVMHALHHALKCGLHEAMALVRSLPVKIGERLWEDQANQLKKRLETAGARVSLLSEPMQDVIERYRPVPRPLPMSDVHLSEVGPNRTQVMYIIHKVTRCGHERAQALVREAPVQLGYVLEGEQAAQLVLELETVGAKAHLTDPPPPEPPEARDHIGPYIPQAQDELSVGIPTPDGGMEWQPCQVLGERQGPAGRMELQLQQCARCHAQGALVSKLPADVNPCPGCGGQQTLNMTGGWIT
ncbi:ribosomal protein L7/L12 [Archangium minus]